MDHIIWPLRKMSCDRSNTCDKSESDLRQVIYNMDTTKVGVKTIEPKGYQRVPKWSQKRTQREGYRNIVEIGRTGRHVQ